MGKQDGDFGFKLILHFSMDVDDHYVDTVPKFNHYPAVIGFYSQASPAVGDYFYKQIPAQLFYAYVHLKFNFWFK